MVSLGLHLLTVLLAVIFIFLGHVKLTPQFFPGYHSQIRDEFGKLNKEFPLYQVTGWRPYAKTYRMALGFAEMSAGCLLLLAGAFSQTFATVALLVIMINLTIALQRLHYSIEYLVGAIFLTLLLVLRLVLVSKSKAAQAVKTAKRNVEDKIE